MESAIDINLPIGYILQKSDGWWYIKSDNSFLKLDGKVISAELHPKLFSLLKETPNNLVIHSDEKFMLLTSLRADYIKK